jgi:hypothetical protein
MQVIVGRTRQGHILNRRRAAARERDCVMELEVVGGGAPASVGRNESAASLVARPDGAANMSGDGSRRMRGRCGLCHSGPVGLRANTPGVHGEGDLHALAKKCFKRRARMRVAHCGANLLEERQKLWLDGHLDDVSQNRRLSR